MKTILAAAALVFAGAASAHDYWMLPDSFTPRAEQAVNVRLQLGQGFKADTDKPFLKSRTVSFVDISAQGARPLLAAMPEEISLARITLKQPGTHVLALERTAASIKMDAQEFAAYLREEGLSQILAERDRAGESAQPARERYTRYLKTRLDVGAASAHEPAAGHRLEIILLRDGTQARAKVLFENQPLADAELHAYRRHRESLVAHTLRTGADGQTAAFALESGTWLLRLTHMRRAPKNDADTDWESYWTAYTFALE